MKTLKSIGTAANKVQRYCRAAIRGTVAPPWKRSSTVTKNLTTILPLPCRGVAKRRPMGERAISFQPTYEALNEPRTANCPCPCPCPCCAALTVLPNIQNQKYRKKRTPPAFSNCLLHFARILNVKKPKPESNRSMTMTYAKLQSLNLARLPKNNSRLMG
jgi:hypothetical protein